MKRILIIITLFICTFNFVEAQKDIKLTRRGNKQFDKGNYSEADVQYKKALEKNPQNAKASFNLGNSQYRQENWEDAATSFTGTALNFENDDQLKAESFYNLGNTLLQQQKYQEGVEAYKQSLRLNPNDEDARYNLAYAQQKLAQQQQQNQDQNKDQKDQKDQKDKEEEDQEQQQNQKDQQDSENKQQQQQTPQEISKEDAEKMLEAMKNKEQNTMEKVKELQVGKGAKMDKDW